jgi:hypothetical protein
LLGYGNCDDRGCELMRFIEISHLKGKVSNSVYLVPA